MRDDDLVALLDQINDRLCRDLDRGHLLGKILSQGIAAQSDHDSLFFIHNPFS